MVLNPALWTQLAASLQFDPSAAASLQQITAREAALERIRLVTRGFAQYAQPRAVWLTLEAWTTENSLMTPTLKIKRNNLAAHFNAQIEALYQQRL